MLRGLAVLQGVCLVVLLIGLLTTDVRYNDSASAPMGFWLLDNANRPISVGDTVAVCVPINRDAIPSAYKNAPPFDRLTSENCLPSLKLVWHIGEVEIGDNNVSTPSDALVVQPQSPIGLLQLKHGEGSVWLTSTHPWSMDSRHYGAVSHQSVTRIEPIWVNGE